MTANWVLVWCGTFFLGNEVSMKAGKSILRLDPYDVKWETLARKGVTLISGEIDEDSAHIFAINTLRAKIAGHFKNRPLVILLNTPGGEVNHGLAIYDTIRMLVACGTQVHIVGIGLIASMGTVIMQAATHRISLPYTQFLVHQMSTSIGYFSSEEVSKLRDRTDEAERLNNVLMAILADRVQMPLEELKAMCRKKDLWMDSKGARELGDHGLIDEISEIPDSLRTVLTEA